MKITTLQLRRIIKEEIVRETVKRKPRALDEASVRSIQGGVVKPKTKSYYDLSKKEREQADLKDYVAGELPTITWAQNEIDELVEMGKDPYKISPGSYLGQYIKFMNELGFDSSMLKQYISDAQLDDDDDQKEGMSTEDYVEMAKEQLDDFMFLVKGYRD